MCAVPGHAVAGMWDTLVVSKSAHSASISMKK
ncbi:MAG: sulfocyanin-like copper-binding protein [Chloroflexota bacterium]